MLISGFGESFDARGGYITDSEWLPETNRFTGHPPYIDYAEGQVILKNQLSDWMFSGSYPISLVSTSEGKLRQTGVGNHWIIITGISSPFIEDDVNSLQNWVRIFNPYDNETEYFPWYFFFRSWANGSFSMTLAHPNDPPLPYSPPLPPEEPCP